MYLILIGLYSMVSLLVYFTPRGFCATMVSGSDITLILSSNRHCHLRFIYLYCVLLVPAETRRENKQEPWLWIRTLLRLCSSGYVSSRATSDR